MDKDTLILNGHLATQVPRSRINHEVGNRESLVYRHPALWFGIMVKQQNFRNNFSFISFVYQYHTIVSNLLHLSQSSGHILNVPSICSFGNLRCIGG